MKNLFPSIKTFIKREPVLFAAIILALIAVAAVHPSPSLCLHAIDFRTIAILFSLMIVIKAFQSQNYLDFIAAKLLRLCKNRRSLYFLLTYLVFFSSMFVTNDVALLTFVPITILIFKRTGLSALKIIVLETLAANLGSCITPMGNPQNLYLFSYYRFSALKFFGLTAKIAIPSLFILSVMIIYLTRPKLSEHGAHEEPHLLEGNVLQNQLTFIKIDFRTFFYIADFIICLLAVFRVINYLYMLIFTVLVMAICNFRLFKKVDYSLLLTFAGFFIFTKTLSTVTVFSDFINSMLSTQLSTYITGIAASQIISNVPAALLLSGFTQNGNMLLLAVNVGGLGTLIASMASVISFKLYSASEEGKSHSGGNYFGTFTFYNVVLLIFLGILVYLF